MRKVILFISLLIAGNLAAKTVSEREAVAACLVLEAGGDGRKGMMAAAHVINNRAQAKNKSFYSVVTQKGQFSTMFRGTGAAIQKSKSKNFAAALPEALAIYDRMKNKTLGADFTHGAKYFESFRENPLWVRRLKKTLTVGGNSFYADRK